MSARDEIAGILGQHFLSTPEAVLDGPLGRHLLPRLAAVVDAEREACLRIVERGIGHADEFQADPLQHQTALGIERVLRSAAAAIRARDEDLCPHGLYRCRCGGRLMPDVHHNPETGLHEACV